MSQVAHDGDAGEPVVHVPIMMPVEPTEVVPGAPSDVGEIVGNVRGAPLDAIPNAAVGDAVKQTAEGSAKAQKGKRGAARV